MASRGSSGGPLSPGLVLALVGLRPWPSRFGAAVNAALERGPERQPGQPAPQQIQLPLRREPKH